MPGHYTKAGARRAVKAIKARLHLLHKDGHIGAKQYVSLSDTFDRLYSRMK
jgi:hypothetical protein